MDEDLRLLTVEAATELHGLSREQTQARPGGRPDRWSIQQIVEHLLATYRGSVPAIRARIDKGSGTRAVPTLRQKIEQFVVIRLGQFSGGRPAPAAVHPAPGPACSGAELLAAMQAELARLDTVTADGERVFGERQAVSHIVLGPLSMRQWRRFHLIHGRHHLKQIRAIRRGLL